MKAALAHGDHVTAVGRSFDDSVEAIEALFSSSITVSRTSNQSTATKTPSRPTNGHIAASNANHTQSLSASPHTRPLLPLLCDVRIRSTVQTIFEKSLQHWGRYDIVANCAGYGVIGACEEQDEFQIRGQFETNFWGTLNILQLSLPYFRTLAANSNGSQLQEVDQDDEDEGDRDWHDGDGGRYLIFSSTSGALGVPGLGPYCATKYAVEGLVESLLFETVRFNIRATLVEPGHVRRDDVSSFSPMTEQAEEVVPKESHSKVEKMPLPSFGHFSILPHPTGSVYSNPSSPAHHAKRVVQWLGGRQPTSAVKAAELVWQLGHCRFPPLRLLLGAFAVESVRERMRALTEEIEDWRGLNFPIDGRGGDENIKRESRSEVGEDEHEAEAEGDGDRDVKMEDDADGDGEGND